MGDLTGLQAPQGADATAHSTVAVSSDSSARAAIRLKDYEIKGVIGEGGIGVVYRARHLVSDKPVAIKVLHEYCGRQKDWVEKLFVEAKAASRIHHPNIADVTDFGTAADGSVFVATGYLDGESLEDRLRRVHRLPLFEAINIVKQVAHGLGAAHELGVVHRDLKPANIFLYSRESRRRIVRRSKETGMRFAIVPEKTFDLVKLLDFGASSFIDFDPSAQTPAEVVCRRPYYLSPEQIQGRPTDQRCDIYALGAVFYQTVTGTLPVSGETVPAIISAFAKGSVIAPSRRTPEAGTSLRIDSVILKCLNRNPSLRFASTAELCTALDECLLGDCAYLRDAHRLPGIQFSGIDLSQASLEARQNVAPATPAEQKPPAEPIAKAAKVGPQTIAWGTLRDEARATASRVPRPDVQSVPKKTDAKREVKVDGQLAETSKNWAPTKGAQKVIVVSGALAQAEATVAKPPAEPIAKAGRVAPQTIAWGTLRDEARATASRVPRPNVQSVPKKTDAKRDAKVERRRVATGKKWAPTKGAQKVIVVSGAPAQAEATVAATPAIAATPALEKYERSPAPWLVAIGGVIAIGCVLLLGLVIAYWPKRDGASRTAQPAATIATPASTPAAPERPAAITPAATPVAPAPSAPAASAAAPVPAVPATAPAVVAPRTPPAPAVRVAAPQGEENTIRVAKAASSASHRGHHKKERGAVAVSSRVSDEARSPADKPAATAEVAARPETEPESSADPFAPSEPETSEGSMGSPTGSSSSVEDRMREAQRALGRGHHKSAIRKARAVLKAEPKPGLVMQAYQIIATSSCALGKVAGAREAASHLDKPALAAVRAACKKDGVAIE